MPSFSGWKRSAEYWKTLPPGRGLFILAGIFSLFFSFGLVLTLLDHTWMDIPRAIGFALIAGLFSTAWAYCGFRRVIWLMIVLLPLQVVVGRVYGTWTKRTVIPSELNLSQKEIDHRLATLGTVGMVSILMGYIFIVAFIRKEGLRMFTTIAEVKLAGEVHKALVPAVSCRLGEFEFYGLSVPSGQIGGDLVDVAEHGANWTAYVADVSGHGVSAGMIMAMVKSAARMGSANGEDMSALLVDLNRVLLSVSAPNVFVTFAGISSAKQGSSVRFALAGHLPVLHYRKRLNIVEEKSVSNLPIGILGNAKFEASNIECDEGDVLAVVTDGLTEASDRHGNELGLDPLKVILLQSAGSPLEQIVNKLRDRSLKQGKQIDDQTVLLVRRSAAA